jgi:phosphoglycerate dehydrogenase-like enzyme
VTSAVDTEPVVLVPWQDPVRHLGALPDGWRYEVHEVADSDAGRTPADRVLEQVRLYVPPYTFDPSVLSLTARMPAVAAVQLLTAGYEHALSLVRPEVALANARGVHDASTAELAVGLILASQRELDLDARAMTTGTWLTAQTRALADCTVLIVGAGSIGHALERRLHGFECSVVKIASRARGDVHGPEELPQLLPTADIVVLLVPLTAATRQMADEAFFARMRPGALLVNVARGGVVDTDALVRACTDGRIRAAVDVTDPEPLPAEHPLWRTPGVLISPHRGGNSAAFLPRAQRLVAEQVARFVAGEPIAHIVVR